jgi:hypothetical protein
VTRGWFAALIFALQILALELAASSAHAQPGATEKETARALVQEGRRKRAAGDLDGALEDFARAHSIMGVPTTAFELGKTQAEARKLVEARDTLVSVMRIPVEGREPTPFRQARDDAKKLANELAARIPSLRIVLTGKDAEGATVSLDGHALSPASVGAPLKLNPGRHEVVAKKGALEKRDSVDIDEGESVELEMKLEAPAARPTGTTPAPAPETSVNPAVWVGLGVAAQARSPCSATPTWRRNVPRRAVRPKRTTTSTKG